MNINTQLNYDCFSAILDLLPVLDQLRVTPVCVQWNHLVEDLCRQRQKLVLSFSEPIPRKPTYIENYLHFDHYLITQNEECINDHEVKLICQKFPNIRTFEFIQRDLHLPKLLQLLEQWSPQMHKLVVSIKRPVSTVTNQNAPSAQIDNG